MAPSRRSRIANPSKKQRTIEQDSTTTAGSLSDLRNWAEMQRDVLLAIFAKIGMIGVLSSAVSVYSPWRKAAKEEPGLWRSIHVGMDGKNEITDVSEEKLDVLVKKAVDWSGGGMEEFWISRVCDDRILRYTGARASNLKSLRIISSIYLSGCALADVLQNLKQLEELELTYCRFMLPNVEAIGQACPHLLRFKLKEVAGVQVSGELVNEEAAIGVANNMHQLRYLQIFGGWISNEGVKAIVQGCPNLETLDVRQCWNVELDTETINLCSRLKRLIRPEEKLSEESEFASKAGEEVPEDIYEEYEHYLDCCPWL